MKKIVFAAFASAAALASLASPAMAMREQVVQPTPAQIAAAAKAEAKREAAVPAADLAALITRWNGISDIRNLHTIPSEFNATVADTAKGGSAVSAAQVARTNANRAEYLKQAKTANDSMNDMCAVLSGC